LRTDGTSARVAKTEAFVPGATDCHEADAARPSLLAIPEAMTFTLNGLHDVLSSFAMLSTHDYALPREPPFHVEMVALTRGLVPTASGLPVQAHAPIGEIGRTDLVIVPSVMVAGGEWVKGRYPEIVRWLRAMHGNGATLCSACSGLLLLAETDLLTGKEATMHWAYEQTFRRNFPDVQLRLEEMLVTAGERQELVMSGAAMAWHDLVLYLIAIDRALFRHALARRRPVALYRLRAKHRARRCGGGGRAGLAGAQFLDRQSRRRDGEALGRARAHIQAPLHASDRDAASRLRAAPAHRAGEAAARAVGYCD
jgi:transcriptional regulator GlxA family with amidase domain